MPTKLSPEPLPYVENLSGKTFCFFGGFSHWKGSMLSEASTVPRNHVADRGATVVSPVQEDHDYLVIGNHKRKGKDEALRKATAWAENGSPIQILNEEDFHYLIRPDLTDIPFYFVGDFKSSAVFVAGAPDLLQHTSAIFCDQLDKDIRVIVIGEGRAKGKTQTLREIEQLKTDGWNGLILNEYQYIQFATLQQSFDTNDINQENISSLVLQLRPLVDERKLDRAIAMLKKEAFKIYADVSRDQLSGVIKSQTESNKIYAPWINAQGKYGCQSFSSYSSELLPCMGLQGKICKHLLALLLGLNCNGEIEPTTILDMVRAVGKKQPDDRETDISAEILLRYKGAEAGEVDWRPVETVPEDFYVL